MMAFLKIFISGLLACLLSMHASAADEAKDKPDVRVTRSKQSQVYYDQIQSILTEKAFGEKKTVKSWRLKKREDKKSEQNKFIQWLSELLHSLGFFKKNTDGVVNVAALVELLLWCFVAALIVYVLVKYRSLLKRLMSSPNGTPVQDLPTSLFGLDVKPSSLPEDVIASAQSLWKAGEQRQAVALLLRASLIKLLNEHQCTFRDSDTEAECYMQIQQKVPKAINEFMRALIQVWQQLAYGHRTPSEAVFESLCKQWQAVF